MVSSPDVNIRGGIKPGMFANLIGPGAGTKLTHLMKYLMNIMKSCENALKVY